MAPLLEAERSVGHDQLGLEGISSVPRPSQAGQAPAGALNENSRGSISSMVKPETGQAKRAENVMRSCVSFLLLLAPSVSSFGSGLSAKLGDGDAVGRGQGPSRSCSASALGDVLAHDEAVHDDVDVVLEFLVQLGRVRRFRRTCRRS